MERSGTRRLAGALKILVTITFLCNLGALPLVPCLVNNRFYLNMGSVAGSFTQGLGGGPAAFRDALFQVWREPYTAVLTVFLLFCGACTAVILWQGRRVLDTILRADTFTFENAANMRRAAVCCLLISAAALLRAVWGVCYYGSPMPLLTYNALFCPIFLMAGLLCMVMSALFRQAAELKAEHDLTI